MKSHHIAALSILLALSSASTGCLWMSGGTGAIVASSSDSGSAKESSTTPAPTPVDLAGAFYSLEGTPREILAGDFVPDLAGHIDLAIVYSGRLIATFLQGDGKGGIAGQFDVPLTRNASNTLAATRRPRNDGGDDLVVATGTTLEWIRLDEYGQFSISSQGILSEQALRDVAFGYFDGDDEADIAVSSEEFNAVEIWLTSDGEQLRLTQGESVLVDSPRAVGAANFDQDGEWDLIVLTVDAEGPAVALFLKGEKLESTLR